MSPRAWLLPFGESAQGSMSTIMAAGNTLALVALLTAASTAWGFSAAPRPMYARRGSPHAAASSRIPAAVAARGRDLPRRVGQASIRPAGRVALRMKEPESFEVAVDDGHKIKVWAKGPEDGKVVVLMHGRTWSARPVWDLQVGSPPRDGACDLGASTMDLMASHGLRTYAPDLRGLGGTSRDSPGFTTPLRSAADLKGVVDYVRSMHAGARPLLVGWSQGAAVAHLYAQENIDQLSGLVLYGSIFNPSPTERIAVPDQPPVVMNTMEGAMEDWTIPGQIDVEAASAFGTEALRWDPRKVSWANAHEFDQCDPAKVTIPTLVIHGEKDAYTDMEKQRALFMGIACGGKAWHVVSNADHPVHLYPRQRKVWMSAVLGFMSGLSQR